MDVRSLAHAVLTKEASPDKLFDEKEINCIADALPALENTLNQLKWPDRRSLFYYGDEYMMLESEYNQAVLADTIRRFHYGNATSDIMLQDNNTPLSTSIQPGATKKPWEKLNVSCTDLLNKMRECAEVKDHGPIFVLAASDPVYVGGNAFCGGQTLGADLCRISDYGIALVKHARENGDFKHGLNQTDIILVYNQSLSSDKVLVAKNLRVVKTCQSSDVNKVKQVVNLEAKAQFQISIVSNRSLILRALRPFSAEEKEETTKLIRAHLTAMINNGGRVAVLTDFGCGRCCNMPNDIAGIYFQILVEENYIQFFDKVEFAIFNKLNADIFQSIFQAGFAPMIAAAKVADEKQQTATPAPVLAATASLSAAVPPTAGAVIPAASSAAANSGPLDILGSMRAQAAARVGGVSAGGVFKPVVVRQSNQPKASSDSQHNKPQIP